LIVYGNFAQSVYGIRNQYLTFNRWQAIDQENEAIEKAKKSKKRFESIVLTNGYTLKIITRQKPLFLLQKQIKMVAKPKRASQFVI
jgi:hypothetical protein